MKNLLLSLFFLIILTSICLFPALGENQKDQKKTDEASKHAINGLELLKSGDYTNAEKELSKAVEMEPKNQDYKNGLLYVLKSAGMNYFQQSKYDEAIKKYLSALKIKSDDVELNYNIAYIYDFYKKLPDKGKIYYAKCLELDPKGSFAECSFLYLGNIYYKEKNYEKASAQYKGAAGLKGTNAVMAHFNLGLCYIKLNKLDQAEKELLEAVKLSPNQPQVYGSLGEVYLKKKDFTKSIENYKKATTYDFNNYNYHLELANAYSGKGDVDLAIQEYSTAISMDSSKPETHYLAGSLYLQKNNYNKAFDEYKKALDLEPANKKYNQALENVKAKMPKETPTPVPPSPTPTPAQNGTISTSLSIKILEPKGLTMGGFQCNASKIRIVGIATAPNDSGIVEVLIDNTPARLIIVSDQYKNEIPSDGKSLQFEGEALLTLGNNQIKISAMDKTRAKIETVFTVNRVE